MLDIDSTYNYYSQSMPKRAGTKLDTHNNRELKSLYSKIAKLNKNTPYYKININKSNKDYAVMVKESAIELNQLLNIMYDDEDGVDTYKTLDTSDNSKLFVSILNDDFNKVPNPLSIEIESLATHQINIGNYMRQDYKSMSIKAHDFSIATDEATYNFSINVTSNDYNYLIQEKLVTAINNSSIPIKASLDTRKDTSAIILESKNQGLPNTDTNLYFTINDLSSGNSLANVLGLNNVFQKPNDALFTLNGEALSSPSNNISINNTATIDLLSPTTKPVNVYPILDYNKSSALANDFLDSYNRLWDFVNSKESNSNNNNKLAKDLERITKNFSSSLSSAGIEVDNEGHLLSNKESLAKSLRNEDFKNLFDEKHSFKESLLKITDKIILDPLSYVDKIIVSYPNTKISFPSPYESSRYTGLLYNCYL